MIDAEDCEVLFELSLCAKLGTEKIAMKRVEQSLSECGWEQDKLEDMKTMTAEGCLNAIEHGCSFCSHLHYHVELTREGREFVLRIRDKGECSLQYSRDTISFPHIEEVMNDEHRVRGWGLLMIDKLSDSWTLIRRGEFTELEIRLFGPKMRGGTAGV